MTTEEKNTPAPAIEMTDADFDNLELFSGVAADAGEYRDEAKEFADRAPISYLDEGNYWLRIYPEIRIEANGQRKLHVMRRFWSYTGIAKGLRRLPAPLGDCPVRAEVTRLKDAKLTDAWKYQAKEEAVVKVYIEKWNGPKDHKYIKPQKPMFLVLRRKQIAALSDFLADISPADLRSILDSRPGVEGPLIKLSFTKGAGGNSSFGFDIGKIKLPALPETFPSLFSVLIDESKVATPEEVQKVRRAVTQLLSVGQNIVVPDGEEAKSAGPTSAGVASAAADAVRAALGGAASASPPPQPPVAPAEQTSATSTTTSPTEAVTAAVQQAVQENVAKENKANEEHPASKVIPIQTAVTNADLGLTCPSGMRFGEDHNPSNMDCIVCPHEPECVTAVQAKIVDVPL